MVSDNERTFGIIEKLTNILDKVTDGTPEALSVDIESDSIIGDDSKAYVKDGDVYLRFTWNDGICTYNVEGPYMAVIQALPIGMTDEAATAVEKLHRSTPDEKIKEACSKYVIVTHYGKGKLPKDG